MINEKQIAVEMIDILIGNQIEHEICSGCAIFYDKDFRCKSGDYCFNLLFQGIMQKAKNSLKSGQIQRQEVK